MYIAYRIDVGTDIGMGHYVRMHALAEAFEVLGCSQKFLTCLDEPIDYSEFDTVVIDTYKINEAYLCELRKKKKLIICIDDNSLYTYNCDILVNPNIYAKQLQYRFYEPLPEILLGSKYALLRKEFWNSSPIAINKRGQNVFVCFGGSDINNMTAFVIDLLKDILDINLHVVLGEYTKCDKNVLSLQSQNVRIYKCPERISDIMKQCDIAVSGAGSIVYELAALGIPSIIIPQIDNQYNIASYFDRFGLMKVLYARDIRYPDILKREVEILLLDESRRIKESVLLSSIVDRKGALNLAQYILERAYGLF